MGYERTKVLNVHSHIMTGWRERVRGDALTWLLEVPDPAVRHAVLVDLLDRDPSSEMAAKTREEMMTTGVVPTILEKQETLGCWGPPEDFYMRSKYKGTVWTFLLLAELGVRGEALDRAGDFVIQFSQRTDGGFTYLGGPSGGRKGHLPCLTGNMVYSLLRTGQGDKGGTKRGVDALVRHALGQREDLHHRCPRCRSGKVKALKALLEIPTVERTPEVVCAIEALADAVADTCVDLGGPPHLSARPEWRELGFPHMWETDLVEVITVLAKARRCDERMRPAVDLILSKGDERGRWRSERSFNGRFIVPMERTGRESSWVTLKVLEMLKALEDAQ